VQFGGVLDGRYAAQSGAPKYEASARYLVVMDRNGSGEWTTCDLALGQFRFVSSRGRQLLHRDATDITGWTESGEPFHDVDRPASLFLAFAREVAKNSPVSASTALQPVSEALDFDLMSVTTTAVGKWHGANSSMNDTVSASPATADTKDEFDGEWRVIADDPHGIVPGTFPGSSSIVATAFFGTNGATSTINSETYYNITSDIVVNDGVSSGTISAGNFLTALTHELGHTWGFHHSNQDANNASCATPVLCDSNAIMRASVVNGLNGTLQSWDLDAVNEVYGDGSRQASFTGSQYVYQLGPPQKPVRRPAGTSWRIWQNAVPCTNAGIGTQPQSTSITSGNSTTLSVVATGSVPFTYLWYVGASGNTSNPVPSATNASVQVSPTSTTSYWVHVSNNCPSSVNSAAATVTVTPCTPAGIGTQPQNVTITSGNSTTLNVVATGSGPFTYQW
jgi:hypothetical protein